MDQDIVQLLSSLNNGNVASSPSPFPSTTPTPVQGPLLTDAPSEQSWISKLFGTNSVGQKTIGSIPMDNLAAVLGQFAKSLTPKSKTGQPLGFGTQLGDFATQLGQAKLQELAATQQHKHLTTMLSSLFADPSKTKSLVNGSDLGNTTGSGSILNQTPQSMYSTFGTEEPKLLGHTNTRT